MELKPCGATECFIRNNWFGASPNHPGNKEAYNRCVACNSNNVPKMNDVRSLIRNLKL